VSEQRSHPIADVLGASAIVVGGTRGIGNAIARRFAQAGAFVGITGRDEAAARAAAAEIGADAAGYALDVCDREAIANVIARFDADRDGADALIYSAGISPTFSSAEKHDAGAWDRILAVNLTGAFLTAQAFGRRAIARSKPASIVFIGSIAGLVGARRLAAYSASKAALIGLAKSMAWDFAPHRIRVNVLAPGWVQTEMTAGMRKNESLSKWIESRTPQGRMAAPEEVADLAVFLASDSASFSTGAVFTADGGWTSG
jgi:NAD(P)-dependent dehydrogenase (short-subunit alcohol dehydrogenase family)